MNKEITLKISPLHRVVCGIFSCMFLGAVSGTTTYAQAVAPPGFEWVAQLGGYGNENVKSVAVDKEGYVYSTGNFDTSITVTIGQRQETINSAGVNDIFISKQKPNGEFVWLKSFGGIRNETVSILAIDHKGGIYITGNFQGTVDFDPGSGIDTHTSVMNVRGLPSPDFFLAKFDTSGKLDWVKVAGGDAPEGGSSIAVDASGEHIVVAGSLIGRVDFGFGQRTELIGRAGNVASTIVFKMKTNGDLVWVKGLSPGVSNGSISASAVALDRHGAVHITGMYTQIINADPDSSNAGALSSAGSGDIYVTKWDKEGKFIWVKSMGGPDLDGGRGIAVDDSSQIYLCGNFTSTANFDPNGNFPLTTVGGPSNDVFIMKMDQAGNMVWAKGIGSRFTDAGNCIALDKLGNVYMAGDFQGSVDFNPSTNVADTCFLTSYGGYDAFLVKLKNDGTFLWATHIGGGQIDYSEGLVVEGGAIYLAGRFYKTTNFDPSGGTAHQLTAGGPNANTADGYILKLKDCLELAGTTLFSLTGPDSVCIGSEYVFAVEAHKELLGYEWALPPSWSGSSDSNTIRAIAGNEGLVTVTLKSLCDSLILSKTVYLYMPEVDITINGFELGTTNAASYHTWQWYLEGEAIAGANEATYTVSQNGTYSVVVTGNNSCTDSASYVVTNYTSLATPESASISLFPNPAYAWFHIKSPVNFHLRWTTLDGRLLKEEIIPAGISRFSLDNYPPGLYLLHMTGIKGEPIKFEKLVKLK